VAAAEAFVGGAEGRGDLAYDVHVLCPRGGCAGAGAEHAGGGLVVVGERHGDAGRGERGHREETASFDVGAAQVGGGQDGILFGRPPGIRCPETDLGLGDGAACPAGQGLGEVLAGSAGGCR
jgi:hypothetical protein